MPRVLRFLLAASFALSVGTATFLLVLWVAPAVVRLTGREADDSTLIPIAASAAGVFLVWAFRSATGWQPKPRPKKDLRRFSFNAAKEVQVLGAAGWTATLAGLYPDFPMVRLCGNEFPTWAWIAPRDEWDNVEAVLGDGPGNLDTSVEPTDTYDEGVRRPSGELTGQGYDPRGRAEHRYLIATATAKSKHNGPAYALDRLYEDGGALRIKAKPGNYFDSVATCEVLEREFIDVLARDPANPVALSQLPRRKWLHDQVAQHPRPDGPGSIVFDGRFRSAALSAAVTMIFRRPNGKHSALLVRRSQEVLMHPGFVHVAPSGIFAPVANRWHTWEEEFSIEQTVVREYAEELFSYDDLEQVQDYSPSLLGFVPPVQRLRQAVADGRVLLRYCGVSVSLLSLRPEVCLLLYVRDPNWWTEQFHLARQEPRPMKFNWEWEPGHHQRQVLIELNSDFEPADTENVHPTRMIPNAAAALYLAAHVARESGLATA
jgi:hypothetical protein